MLPGLDQDALTSIALALALGLLVGVERGWTQRDQAPGTRFAGIRTYGLLGLAGGLGGALQAAFPVLSGVLLAATAVLVVMGYWRSTRGQTAAPASISGTASLVGLLTLACGFVAGAGAHALASAATGVMVLVLAMRHQLHDWIRQLDQREVLAIAHFALIALVILPLLPDTPMGPLDAWRPRQIWLVVVLVCGFSFLGYIAAHRLGATKGTLATAAAGSMVSSTAVTAAVAGRLRDGSGDPATLNSAIALASAVMFIRVMALVAALAPFALTMLLAWALPGMAVSLIGAWLIGRRRPDTGAAAEQAMPLRNPFALGPALLLAALVMVLSVAARWVLARYGDAGLATVLALSGMLDVDSAIITMGNLPAGTVDPRLAALILMPPVLLNTLIKAGAAIGLAGWAKAWRGAAVLGGSTVAALVALPFLWPAL
ncbi:MAG: MgtC/SapB family protein [Pseudomonadota bacterium]